MEDECSIEELTAFLESSDDEGDDTTKNTDNKQGTVDEIGDEDIQAFLEASDIEDGEAEESEEVNKDLQAKGASVNHGSSADYHVGEPDFDDMDEADFDELDQMVESKCSQETSQSMEGDGHPEIADPPVKDDKEDVKSEMAAMAERIKQLEAMLSNKGTVPDTFETNQSPAVTIQSARSPALTSQSGRSPAGTIQSARSPAMAIQSARSPAGTVQSARSPAGTIQSARSPAMTIQSAKSSRQGVTVESRNKQIANVAASKKLKQAQDTVAVADDNPFFATMQTQKPRLSESSKAVTESRVDAKSLFGESDDSDWDELDGGEKTKLTEEGRELKKIMTNHKRVAHKPSFDPAILKKPNLKDWNETKPAGSFLTTSANPRQPEKPALNPETGTVSGKYKLREEYRPRPTTLQKEDERESVTDPYCGIRIINPRISMEEFRQKMSGRTMAKIPRLLAKTGLADLQKDNWVTVGVVVHKTEPRQSASGKTYCIWKLSDLQNCDSTVTFFLFGNVYKDHWKNDLGVVIGLLNPSLMDKAEKAQSEVAFTINHPGQLLILGISKDLGRCRGVTKAGQPCSSFINKLHGEYCTYHVQAAYRKSSSKRTELQASTGVVPKAFEPKKQNNKSGCFFYGGNTFSTMRPQTKSGKDQMNLKKLQTFESKKAVGKVTTMSLHDLEPRGKARLAKLEDKDKALLDLLSVPTAGAMNFVKHLVVNKDKVATEVSDKPTAESMSAKDLLKQHRVELHQKKLAARRPDPLKATPTLGKGFSLGQDISLDVPMKKAKGAASAELAKQLAIQKVKAKGGIEKEDPNSIKKKLTSPEAKAKIRKRVAEDMDSDDKSPRQNKECSQPPRKKSKFLGDLDLNSPEVQSLLKAKSKHTGALAEAEAEHEEKYFSALEQKEKMEDKMSAIMEVPVTLVVCLKCKYKYFSLAERCKKENHPTKKVKGTKRFFRCKQCKRRTVSVERLPSTACKDCGSGSFERVSMLKERSGPKLESEELCIRGNEQKFVGSLQGKTFLNV